MTPERRAEYRRLADAATPGPWEWSHLLNPNGLLSGDCEVIAILPEHTCSLEMLEADAAFIAASRTAVPELLDEVERLEALNASLKTLVRKMEFCKHYRKNEWDVCTCPICGGGDPLQGYFDGGHAPDCPVAAEIAELCGEE